MPNLYDQTVSPGGTHRNDWGGTVGNRFALAADGYLRSVSWYSDSPSGTKPGFNVWNNASNLRLQKLAASITWTDNGHGWWTYELTESESTSIGQITNNTTWELDLIVASGGAYWFQGCHTPDNVTDFSYEGARYGGPSNVIADSTAGAPWGINVGVATTAGGDPSTPPATGTTTADLAAWFSANSAVNTHQTDLPWLTKTVADAIKNAVDVLTHSGSGSNLDWVVALWKLAGNLTDLEYAAVRQFLKDGQTRLTGAGGGGGSAFYGPSGTQVAAGVETLLAQGVTPTDLGAAVALLRERLTLSPDLADTSRWTLVDTLDGSEDALFSAQADAYFLSVTAVPSYFHSNGVAATLWLPKFGWVAPRVHGHFRQRQFNDVFPLVITADGLFMDGLLIHTLPGFEWTVEAYTLDRS